MFINCPAADIPPPAAASFAASSGAEVFTAAIADLALRAMLAEVNLSPKPGLVDRLNNGAHKDMCLADFHRSAYAIHAELPQFIRAGAETAALPAEVILPRLRPIGLKAEAAMFCATGGVNTHKGSIFSLGLLCAAAGRLRQNSISLTAENLCRTAAAFCRGITARELGQITALTAKITTAKLTAGQRLYRELGLTGARGQAEAGWPLVLRHALPAYRAARAAGAAQEPALLNILLLLMARNGDTNLAARGGKAGLLWAQNQAQMLLAKGGIRTCGDYAALHKFNQQCTERNLSPGGSADLLIITWFLAHLPNCPSNI